MVSTITTASTVSQFNEQAARLVDKILQRTSPARIPVEVNSKKEVVIESAASSAFWPKGVFT